VVGVVKIESHAGRLAAFDGRLRVGTVGWVVDMLEYIRGRGWRVSALVVGVLALFVGGWVAAISDIGGVFYLAVAVGFAGIVTLVLIPRTNPQDRRSPTRGADEA
jgi:hypothetical protein